LNIIRRHSNEEVVAEVSKLYRKDYFMANGIQINKLGINWKLRYDLERSRNELLETRIDILIRRLRKYEDYNTRPTRDRKDNNVVKFSRSVHTTRDKT
tara:strand:+ start:992 stop:1285 length:294 start_codon:yes stop_codon:yes gene_type:complete